MSVPLEVELGPIEKLIVLPLITDIFLDGLFIDTDRGDEVSPAPEGFLSDGTFSGEQIVHPASTFAFEEAHDVGN